MFEEGNLHTEAITYHEKVIELNPNFTPAYLNLGIAYGNSKQFKKAIEIWKKYLKLNKNDATAKNYIERAQALLKNNS